MRERGGCLIEALVNSDVQAIRSFAFYIPEQNISVLWGKQGPIQYLGVP